MFLPLAISFIPLFCLSVAQDFSVPSEWVNTTSTHSWDDRVQLAQSVIDSVIPHYDASKGQLNELFFGQNANLMSAIVIHDSLVPNRTNYNTTTDNFLRVVPSLVPTINGTTIGVTNDPLMWGLTGIYAYRAYNERPFLDNAISIWEQISVYMITRQDAASNSHPLKNITFPLECNGISLAGGVFWNSNSPQNTGINAGTSGAYMALSAYLYEMTNNNTSGDAAELSRQFIQSHLYNESAGYVMDFLDPPTCSIANNFQWTYNMGLYLEAISVYANKTNNVTLTDFANELTVHAVKSTAWNGVDGINTEELPVENVTTNAFSMAYKGMLIRALYEHWSRSPEGSDVAKLIESYIMI
ncbi:unnamed protein product [Somion occarium]|uniref:Glycoside hydrolase family 76 protein n=1 Tax=Somion occarium TaxID=3059160 RepID=A0ABP1CR73_9APHY